jgi:hypothetical protein
MKAINADLLRLIPVTDIQRVTFYKRDELATDLICCDVEAGGQTWFFHEELRGWNLLLAHLEQLPRFLTDWHARVAQPPFVAKETVAFCHE